MRRTTPLVAAVLAALLVAPLAGASASDVRRLLSDPALANDPRIRRLERLDREVFDLTRGYERLEAEAGRASLAYVDAARAAEAAEAAVEAAHARLDGRIRTAYQMGPGAVMEAFLGAETLADLAAIGEYTSRTVSLDLRALTEVTGSQIVAVTERARADAELAALAPHLQRLQHLLAVLRAKLEEAAAVAEELRLEHLRYERQQRALADAQARQDGWRELGATGPGTDQSTLLALLGPTGGRTCDTPPGLVDTGESFSGWATWYGWDFAGQSTASGAVFDPRLFTAANRWLPFGTFLRIRNGDRCAIVLVNDRGPYGNLERVIDLSQAAGAYLGVGVSWVDAQLLVPAQGLPD